MLTSQGFLTLASQLLWATALSSQVTRIQLLLIVYITRKSRDFHSTLSSLLSTLLPPLCLFSSFTCLISLPYDHLILLLPSSISPLNLTIYLYTNPTLHLSASQFYCLSSTLSIDSPVISYSYRHSILELEGFHSQLKNQAQVGWADLLVAASGLQSNLLTLASLYFPLHNSWGDLNVRNPNFWVSSLCIL